MRQNLCGYIEYIETSIASKGQAYFSLAYVAKYVDEEGAITGAKQ